jgi:acetate kinase
VSAVRSRNCEGLSFLGIELNESRNAEAVGLISTDASRAKVRVIRKDEELMIARSVRRVLGLDMASDRRIASTLQSLSILGR